MRTVAATRPHEVLIPITRCLPSYFFSRLPEAFDQGLGVRIPYPVPAKLFFQKKKKQKKKNLPQSISMPDVAAGKS